MIVRINAMGRGMCMMDQEIRLHVFEDTLDRCAGDFGLLKSISSARAGTWIGRDAAMLAGWMKEQPYGRVLVAGAESGVHCLEMLEDMHREVVERRILVVLSGSVMYPGGGVTRGMDEPEAQLCRCSTLYSCLNWELPGGWYRENRAAFRDRGGFVFTPGIMVLRGARSEEWLQEEERYLVDVVTGGSTVLAALQMPDDMDTGATAPDWRCCRASDINLSGIV